MKFLFLCAFALPVFAGSPLEGIHNFHQVDEHVYRGGQPSRTAFDQLAKMGIKTVIDLREPGKRSLKEASVVTAAGMRYINVPMSGLFAPTAPEIQKILEVLEDQGAVVFSFIASAGQTERAPSLRPTGLITIIGRTTARWTRRRHWE